MLLRLHFDPFYTFSDKMSKNLKGMKVKNLKLKRKPFAEGALIDPCFAVKFIKKKRNETLNLKCRKI